MNVQNYYSRQIPLPEVGLAGQQLLQNGKCLVVGAGGLGSPVLMYLASAGIGVIGICDGDLLEESNLHRQPIYSYKDIGKSKTQLASLRIKELNPSINPIVHPFRLTESNAIQLFQSYDLILDCTDNFRAKFLINDAAYLTKKPVVRSSIYQFEGQLQTYIPERGDACLRCLWEDIPVDGCVGTCQQVGVLGPVPGYFGILQAMEAIKYFIKMPLLASHTILFNDLVYYTQRTICYEKKFNCPLCGNDPKISFLSDKELWEVNDFDPKINKEYQLVDIREVEEVAFEPYWEENCLNKPLNSFNANELDPSIKYLFFCKRGARSARLVSFLREKGVTNVYSLMGGIDSL